VPCAAVALIERRSLNVLNSFGGRKPEQSMIGVVIRAGVEPYQRHELMQMFKETSQTDQLPRGCLERRVYEEAHSPTNLLLVEQWSDKAAMNAYLSSDQFRALIGAVKVLGKLVDVRVFEATSIRELAMRLKVEEC
jgi:quinol monooxygenase YgiN